MSIKGSTNKGWLGVNLEGVPFNFGVTPNQNLFWMWRLTILTEESRRKKIWIDILILNMKLTPGIKSKFSFNLLKFTYWQNAIQRALHSIYNKHNSFKTTYSTLSSTLKRVNTCLIIVFRFRNPRIWPPMKK